MLNQKASTLSKSLVDDPENYNYANSIWQDKLGNSVSLREAIVKEGKEKVLNKIRTHYVDQAIEASGLNKAISAQMPKPEKADKYESDKDLVTLSRNIGKVIPIEGINYKIVGNSKDKGSLYIQAERETIGDVNKETAKITMPSKDFDKTNEIPLYNYNEKTKKYYLNYGAFRTLTGSKGRKQ